MGQQQNKKSSKKELDNRKGGSNCTNENKPGRLPKHFVFPSKGFLYEALADQQVDFITSWHIPYTGNGRSMLYRGEKIWMAYDIREERPLRVDALPVDYLKLEARMVPFHERNDKRYRGFFLSIEIRSLNETFKLLRKDFSKDILD